MCVCFDALCLKDLVLCVFKSHLLFSAYLNMHFTFCVNVSPACTETPSLHTHLPPQGKPVIVCFQRVCVIAHPIWPCVCECERSRGDGEFGAAEK